MISLLFQIDIALFEGIAQPKESYPKYVRLFGTSTTEFADKKAHFE